VRRGRPCAAAWWPTPGPPFDLRATETAADRTYSGIVRLVHQAEPAQPPLVRLADRYALRFLGLSLAAAGIAWAADGAARAVAALVVATPCPLILAAPVALVGGPSQAARHGREGWWRLRAAGVVHHLAVR
jgi:cation transport ATPase